jgi:hypothetical protein
MPGYKAGCRVCTDEDTSGTAYVWPTWTVTATATTANVIWTQWLQLGSATTSNTIAWVRPGTAQAIRQVSPEEAQRQLRQAAQYNEERIRVEGEKQKARQRAEVLLREHLDERQKAVLAEKGYFELEVLSKNGERRKYRIHRQWSGNIQQVDDQGRRLKTLCIHPRIATPVEDSMLAQKLMLESGMEEELLRIANHS